MAESTRNTDRLDEMFKPVEKKVDILKEALEEVSKERAEERKKAAKDLIRKALDLKKQMDDAENQFLGQKRKWDKELGKVMNRLNNMASGRPLDEGSEEDSGNDDD